MIHDFPFKDEAAFQIATAILLRKELPPHVVWFAVPNGEWRDPATARKLKEMGVKPGVADFLIFGWGCGVKLALELKTPKGVLSKNQKDFRDAWTYVEGRYEVARSLDEVRAILWKHSLLFAKL
jgi:hypothetical protein